MNYGLKSFRYLAPKIWNIIPLEIKNSGSLPEFITNIKSWIPKHCPCTLCRIYIHHVGYKNISNNNDNDNDNNNNNNNDNNNRVFPPVIHNFSHIFDEPLSSPVQKVRDLELKLLRKNVTLFHAHYLATKSK